MIPELILVLQSAGIEADLGFLLPKKLEAEDPILQKARSSVEKKSLHSSFCARSVQPSSLRLISRCGLFARSDLQGGSQICSDHSCNLLLLRGRTLCAALADGTSALAE